MGTLAISGYVPLWACLGVQYFDNIYGKQGSDNISYQKLLCALDQHYLFFCAENLSHAIRH